MSSRPSQRPHFQAGDGSAVDDLVFAALERIEREGMAALEDLCASHPSLASALRARISALRDAGLLGTGGSDATVPEQLGDFRLRARLGAGGMGVVYRAEQLSLRREVALKLVRPEHLYFDGARRRFAREVAAVARLSHPGIAAVHTVGEQDGVPFFAMELVNGASLAEALSAVRAEAVPAHRLQGRDLQRVICRHAGVPDGGRVALFEGSWIDTCLRVVRHVADALQHAHGHGVLHRDVKPSNIMMTPEGRVLLVDFGLASSSGVARLTGTGARVGSAPYMPPEVARGDHVEPSVTMDVYSLGATLYELLTLRPPHTADTTPGLLAAVAAGHVTPPRALDRSVPPDVDIVCSVAMDPDPGRRYRTAAALARDLDHALARRPVEARPIATVLRLRRWVQRSPARATAVALAALLVVGGPAALAVQQSLARARLAEALALAEENFDAANDAVEFMLTEVGRRDLAHVPQMDAVRQALLERALEFHQRFLDQEDGDFDVRLRAAEAHYNVGTVRRLLGEMDLAAAAHREAIRRYLELLAERPDHAPAWGAVARARGALAYLRAAGGDVAGACALNEAALEDLAEAVRCAPDDDALVRQRVVALMNAGTLRSRLGDHAAALTLLDEALQEIEPLAARDGAPGDEYQRASVLAKKGTVLYLLDRLDRAPGVLQAAVDALAELVARHPRPRGYRRALGSARHNLGVVLKRRGELQRARETLMAGAEGFRRLTADFPNDRRVRLGLALTLSDLAWLELEHGDDTAARPVLEECLAALQETLEVTPDDPSARRSFRKNQRRMVRLLLHSGEHSALAELAAAWAELPWCDASGRAFCATALARAVQAAATDASLDSERRAAAAAEYRRRALSLLRRAVDGGWRDAAALRSDSLAALRDAEEYATLLERVPRKDPRE